MFLSLPLSLPLCWLVLLLVLTSAALTVPATNAAYPSALQAPHTIYLRTAIVDMSHAGHNELLIKQGSSFSSSSLANDELAAAGYCEAGTRCQWLLHYISSESGELNRSGQLPHWLSLYYPTITVINYIPHHTYHILASREEIDQLHSSHSDVFLSTTPFHPSFKASEIFSSSAASDATVAESDPILILTMVAGAFTSLQQLQTVMASHQLKLASSSITVLYQIQSLQTVLVTVSASDSSNEAQLLNTVVQEFSVDHAVLFVSRDYPTVLHNDDAVSLVQSGQSNNSLLHAHGLLGDDQLVAVADDWLDVNQCFFVDTVPVVKCVPSDNSFQSAGCISTAANEQHRKIAAYLSRVSDTPAADNAHGTHVAGSVAGAAFNPSSSISQFDGAAPHSRLVFTQIGTEDGLYTYQVFEQGLIFFAWSYVMGARIHSNSWGITADYITGEYGETSSDLDSYIYYLFPDLLVIFAAGNDGDASAYVALGEHQQAKNVLTVGSSQTSTTHFTQEVAAYTAISNQGRFQEQMLCSLDFIDSVFECINAAWTADGQPTLNTSLEMTRFLCEQYSANPANISCRSPSAWIACFPMDIRVGCPVALQILYQAFSADQFNEHTVSYFSTYGPAADKRIKPDVLAPGDAIISARSHANSATDADYACNSDVTDLTSMSGTSMATPITAGSAALVRQYYTQGYHLNGLKNISVGIQPSAALMKATLISSAIHALSWGNCNANNPFTCSGPALDFNNTTPLIQATHEGFGIVQLDTVLQLQGNATVPSTNVTLFAYDACAEATTLSHGAEAVYRFTVTDTTRPFKATLVWTDPPAAPFSAMALINNLDLTVIDEQTTAIYYGNDHIYQTAQADHINNVEQVWINTPTVGSYTVYISATAINIGNTQDYALVVTYADGIAMIPSTSSSCHFNSMSITYLNEYILSLIPSNTTLSPSQPPINTANNSEHTMIVGLSIGLGITGFFFCLLLVVVIIYCLLQRKRQSQTAAVELGNMKPNAFQRLSISAGAIE